jgi:hypothetical protein
VQSTVASFLANLPEMLGAMARDPRCLVAVAEFEDVRYVQFWVEPDGEIIAEVISNLNIGDAVALSATDEELLRTMGWDEPSPGPNPNWRFEGRGPHSLMNAALLTSRAVFEVLKEKPTNVVTLKSWEMKGRVNESLDRIREEARVSYQRDLRDLERRFDEV